MKRFILTAVLLALTASYGDACPLRSGRVRAGVQTATTKVRSVTRTVAAAPVRVVNVFAAPCPGGKCAVPAAKK